MDLTTPDFIRIAVGAVILLYVANCLLNQKVWIRKTFSWGTKEEYPKIFQMNIIGGILIGLFLVATTNNWIRISWKGLSETPLHFIFRYNGLSVGSVLRLPYRAADREIAVPGNRVPDSPRRASL